MSAPLLCALFAPLFAAAGWCGAVLGDVLCRGREPYDDGPLPVHTGRLPFAVIAAAIGTAIALHGVDVLHAAELALVTFALAGCAKADLRCGIVPDVLSMGALALVLGTSLAGRDVVPAISATLVFVPFAVAALATRGRGMGWGDVKLAALGGALLGVADATFAFMLAALAAYAIARITGSLRRSVAFGPYLAASIAAMLAIVRIS